MAGAGAKKSRSLCRLRLLGEERGRRSVAEVKLVAFHAHARADGNARVVGVVELARAAAVKLHGDAPVGIAAVAGGVVGHGLSKQRTADGADNGGSSSAAPFANLVAGQPANGAADDGAGDAASGAGVVADVFDVADGAVGLVVAPLNGLALLLVAAAVVAALLLIRAGAAGDGERSERGKQDGSGFADGHEVSPILDVEMVALLVQQGG